MMYELKIRLTSQMLGDVRTHEKVRRFERCRRSSDLQPDAVMWRWALKEAKESLRLNVHTDCIMIPPAIRAPRLDLYKRKYRKPGKREMTFEEFEAINIGAILTITLQVNSADPKKKDAVSPGRLELEQLFRFIGKFIGLSPWGNKFDFGRFEVLSVTPLENEDDIPASLYHR